MKKDNSSTVITICYMLIALLIIMIFVPPLIKYLYPKDPIINSAVTTLTCTKTEPLDMNSIQNTIETRYRDENIKSIKFSYETTSIDDFDITKYMETSILLQEYTKLSNIENVKLIGSITEDKFSIGVENKIISKEEMNLYNGTLEKQKEYYESNRYDCMTKED